MWHLIRITKIQKQYEENQTMIIHLFSGIIFILFSLSGNLFAQEILNIGTDDWPPYEMKIDGKITGYATEVIQSTLKQMYIDTKIQIYPWVRAENLVFSGTIDALFSSSKSEIREKHCYFPDEPLLESAWVIFIRKEDQGKLSYRSFEDIKGKTVGVVRSYSYTPEFWNFIKTKGKYEEVATDQVNFKKLLGKRFNYLVCEYAVGLAIAKSFNASNKVFAFTNAPIKKTGLYIMFSKKNLTSDFVNLFSKELKSFKGTSEFQVIHKKYFP